MIIRNFYDPSGCQWPIRNYLKLKILFSADLAGWLKNTVLGRVQHSSMHVQLTLRTITCETQKMGVVFLAFFVLAASAMSVEASKNVLYFVIDDLRPGLGAYDQQNILTPNIDKLAEESLVFERAYCQQAVCGPSRNSFMTGRRPDTTKAWNFKDHFREPNIGLNWTSMPQYFKNHGYFTSGAGKLYHPGLPPNNDPPSWSDLDKFPYVFPPVRGCPNRTTWCPLPRKNNTFCDVNSTDVIVARLRHAAEAKLPFFLGLGIHKPHLPWRYPRDFLNSYPSADQITPAIHRLVPEGMPPVAFHLTLNKNEDLAKYDYNITHPFPVDLQREMRRQYYAATSYMDSLVGRLLDELDRLGLKNDTVVAFHSDHGYQLGEHNEWCKSTNFELGTRVPLIVRAPWMSESTGRKTSALVELVDVYPTLVELAGLPPASGENLNGVSLAPLFRNPNGTVKDVALSQYPRCNPNPDAFPNKCLSINRTRFDFMGYSMRTDRYRYTEWVRWNGTELRPEWSENIGVELYDHQGDTENDFDAYENVNIAESQPDLVKEFSSKLHELFSK